MYDRSLIGEQGKLTEATTRFEQSLIMFEKGLGPDHPHVASLVNNLASLFEKQV